MKPPTPYTRHTGKRKRRTKAETQALEVAIYAYAESAHPTAARTVFYRLVVAGLASLNLTPGINRYIFRLGKMRIEGRLPYEWISDDTRLGYHVDTFKDAADFQRRVASLYRSDIWRDVAEHVEVWVESRSLAGILRETCADLAVSLYPCAGFSSLSQEYSAAHQMAASRKAVASILYVGDFDPGGETIEDALQRKLGAHLANLGMGLEFQRLGLTKAQVERYGLPTAPRKAGERRKPEITETTEAEALDSRVLRAMVREAVLAYLPAGRLEAARIADESERRFIRKLGFTVMVDKTSV